jgi:putative phosphoserine phosphatase/1-acylglycerol-3-phosphate O-acyltransferase
MSEDSAQKRPGATAVLRTLLALGAVIPPLVAGAAVLVASADRRRAINTALGLWGDWGTRAAGIGLEVTGREHLTSARPAVFVLNHRSGVDPILVCALLRRDFVAVAKREIRRNPLLGPAFAFAGVVFVDRAGGAPQSPRRAQRAGGERSQDALEPALAALRSGLSLAIAPEGTRSRGDALGAFKTGAFRIAQAARVPVVPVVIHNADDVLPRGGWIMRAARVRVDVLAPVSTQGWDASRIDAHAESVRAQFLAALATGRRRTSSS